MSRLQISTMLVLALASARVAFAQSAARPDAGVSEVGAAAPAGNDAGVPQTGGGPGGVPAAVPPSGPTDVGSSATGEPQIETGSGLFEQASAAAQPTSAPGGAESSQPPFTLTGYTRGDAFIGKVPGFRTGEMKAAYGELSLALKTAKHKHGDGFAEARVRYGLQGGQQQTFLDLREAYANTYLGPFDLRVGRQIVVWGRADVLNPTNNITPLDIRIRSPIEDDRRLGNFGARMFARLAPLRFEGVWMPMYLPSELPLVGFPPFVTFAPPTFPNAELKNGLVAGRVHLELPAFELSFSYLHGPAPLPGLTLSGVTFGMSPEVRVSRTAYIHDVLGGDFSTALGDIVTIRAEAALRRPVQYQGRSHVPRPDFQGAGGLDWTFGPVNVITQYLGRYTFDWQQEPIPGLPINPAFLMGEPSPVVEAAVAAHVARTNQILFNQTARMQHLGTARIEWLTLHDTLSLSTLGLVNFTTREWLLAPKVGYRISDAIVTYLGAEIFSGPDGTLFGLIEEVLSAGYAELRVTF